MFLIKLINLINCLKSDVNDTILNKITEKAIRITDLPLMAQGSSWIHKIPFVEKNYVMSAYVNNTRKYSLAVYITICVLLLL